MASRMPPPARLPTLRGLISGEFISAVSSRITPLTPFPSVTLPALPVLILPVNRLIPVKRLTHFCILPTVLRAPSLPGAFVKAFLPASVVRAREVGDMLTSSLELCRSKLAPRPLFSGVPVQPVQFYVDSEIDTLLALLSGSFDSRFESILLGTFLLRGFTPLPPGTAGATAPPPPTHLS